MANGVIKAKIFRFNPDVDKESYYQDYEVVVEDKVTVSELLEMIHRDHDGTLAFRPYKCYKGYCSTCVMKLNGKTVRSCATPVDVGSEIQLDPAGSGEVVRDLVVDFKNM